MTNWGWRSFLPFSGSRAKNSARRRADRLSVRLELNTLESRVVPSGGKVTAPTGPAVAHVNQGNHFAFGGGTGSGFGNTTGGIGGGTGGGQGGGAGGATSGSSTGTISGIVVDNKTNTPLSGVQVTLTDSTGLTVGVFTTGADGSWSFGSLAGGTYTLSQTTDAPGYVDPTGPVSVSLAPGATDSGLVLGEVQVFA
ncbi:MAG: collagen binding domain-containing protein [Gemmataceae bacterium]